MHHNAVDCNVTRHPFNEVMVVGGLHEALQETSDAFYEVHIDAFLQVLDNASWTLEQSSLGIQRTFNQEHHTSNQERDVSTDQEWHMNLETVREDLRPPRPSKRACSVNLEMYHATDHGCITSQITDNPLSFKQLISSSAAVLTGMQARC